ncbi:MAG: phosphoglucosamine mutase [Holosporales bacterium]|jgi:phosphoglucosamine mutase|nr:phosphoglucosamine mutase [Holosporales bacterium]
MYGKLQGYEYDMWARMGDFTIFGTDGVRGRANDGMITPLNVTKLAVSVVNYYFATDHKSVNDKFTVVIGKDTRLSGYMLEPALTAGFIAAGADVVLLGPIPTPGVAFMTKSLRADLGVVISASHNPYYDNGIKFFSSEGFKISTAAEIAISEIFAKDQRLAPPDHTGKAMRLDDAAGRYVEFIKSSFPRHLNLTGLKMVVDSANGAAYKIAPQVFWELGAEIVRVGCEPNGLNINKDCGATDTKKLQKVVLDNEADIGIALDGDADRLIVIDEIGDVIDGDFLISAIAMNWQNEGRLSGKNVVATTMSNIGMEKYLNSIGLMLLRSDVGDKNVIQKMIEIGANIGGEKSGHIIPIDYSTTGDGIISSLQILSFLKKNALKTSELKKLYEPYPQVTINIPDTTDMTHLEFKTVEEEVKKIVGDTGRVIIRRSGTEPITRIMIEAETKSLIDRAIKFFM